jgi:hypothetical protein
LGKFLENNQTFAIGKSLWQDGSMAIEKLIKPILHAVSGEIDAWKCSACGADFSGSKMKLVNSFGAHVRQQHKPAAKPAEDFNPEVVH